MMRIPWIALAAAVSAQTPVSLGKAIDDLAQSLALNAAAKHGSAQGTVFSVLIFQETDHAYPTEAGGYVADRFEAAFRKFAPASFVVRPRPQDLDAILDEYKLWTAGLTSDERPSIGHIKAAKYLVLGKIHLNPEGKQGQISVSYVDAESGEMSIAVSEEFRTDAAGLPFVYGKPLRPCPASNCSKMNDRRCQGRDIEECLPNLQGCLTWSKADQCGTTQECHAGKCDAICQQECRLTDVPTCQGQSVVTCQESNGCRRWQRTLCRSSTKCVDGSCQSCQECDLFGKRCSGNEVQECQNAPGGCTRWVVSSRCSSRQSCVGDECKCRSAECPYEGAHRCRGATLEECTEDGGCLAWSARETCQDDETCTTDGCVPAVGGYCCDPNTGVKVCRLLPPLPIRALCGCYGVPGSGIACR